ncbi:MAG: PAS domain S-box protein [Desulfotalea sp.]
MNRIITILFFAIIITNSSAFAHETSCYFGSEISKDYCTAPLFYCFVILAIALLIAFVWSYFLKKRLIKKNIAIKKQREDLEIQVEERTKELSLAIEATDQAQKIANTCTVEYFFEENQLKASAMYNELFCIDPDQTSNIYNLVKKIHPEDKLKVKEALQNCNKNNPEASVEFRVLLPRGTKHFWFTGEVLFGDNLSPSYMVGTVQDVTTRLESERDMNRFMRLKSNSMRLSKSGSWYVDYIDEPNVLQGTHEYFNLMGFMPINGGRLMSFDDLKNFDPKNQMSEFINTVIKTTEDIEISQKSFQYSNNLGGEIRWFKVILDVERDLQGAPIYISGVDQEITQEIKARSELQQNQERLIEAQRIGKTRSWYWDFASLKFDWSNEIYDFSGNEEQKSYSLNENQNAVPKSDSKIAEEIIKRAAFNPMKVDFEHRLRKKNGEIRYLQVHGEPVYDPETNHIGYKGITQDITDIRMVEKEAILSRALLEASPNIIILCNINGELIYLNKTGRKTFGLDLDIDISNLHYSKFHPSHCLSQLTEVMLPTVKKNGFWRGETKLLRADGIEFSVYAHIFPMRDAISGKITSYSFVAHDITDYKKAELTISTQAESLRQSQERFNLSINSANVGVWDYTPNKNSFYVNHILKGILGYKAQEKLPIGVENLKELVHPEDCHIVDSAIIEHLMNRTPNCNIEVRVKLKNGNYKWVNIIGKIMTRQENNSVKRAVGIMMDIDEMHQLREDLIIAKNIAETVVETKSNFLANMSHEIRTPMNAIIGLSHLALTSDSESEKLDFLQNIHKSSNSLLSIINDILDFSKIEAGMTSIEKIPFRIEDMARQVLNVFKLSTKNLGIQLNFQIDNNVPETVLGDPLRLRQVLTNIIGNGVKFTDKGSVSLKLGVGDINDDECEIIFEVTDTGIGMTTEEIAGIYSAFNQANVSTTRKYGGTGLGLAITKSLVEIMDGKISVKSEKGMGSIFSVRFNFPILENETQIDELKKLSAPPNLEGLHVLVVEDEIINRQVIIGMLKKTGCQISTATNGKEGIEIVQKEKIDLIFMDIQMPVMDGIEATKIIRSQEKFKELPIIATTAGVMPENRLNVSEAGLNVFLPKPISVDDLYIELTKWKEIISA